MQNTAGGTCENKIKLTGGRFIYFHKCKVHMFKMRLVYLCKFFKLEFNFVWK